MLIVLKDNNNKTVVKDIFNINFDMSVSFEKDNKFHVKVNKIYELEENFSSEEEAIAQMLYIADCRNNLEDEIRNS